MARITKKALPAFENKTDDIKDPVLVKWFSLLQLYLPELRTFSPSIDIDSVGANSYGSTTVTVVGLATTDSIIVNPPALTADLHFISARVSAANTMILTFYNDTGGAINEAAATYYIVAIRN